MKKLLTILLVLISFSTFAQFEAGEFVNSDTAKITGSSIIYPHADSVEQFYYSKMRDPSEPLDGVNLRTLFDRLASLDTLGLNVSDLVSGTQIINAGETQIFFPSAFDSTNVIVVPFVRRISDNAVIDFTINDIDSLGFDVVVWDNNCKLQYVASQKITHSSDIFKEPIYSADSAYLKMHVRTDFDTDSANEIQDLSGLVPFSGADRDLDLGANSINTDTVKLNGVPLLLNTFKQGNLGGAGNIFYSTGASSQPTSGSVNQVVGGNALTKDRRLKWDGSKFANTFEYETATNWTIHTSAADNGWYSVCYGNGLFVAVANSGSGNRVMTSPDGINWTIRTSAADNGWFSVCYGNGLFVAVAITGSGNRVMTSGFVELNESTNYHITVGDQVVYGNITGDTVNIRADLMVSGEIYNEINHLYGMVFDSTIVITLTKDVWRQVTNSTKTLYSTAEQDGITILGDTIVFSKAGGYDVYFEINGTGINSKEYHYRILQKNGSTVVRSYNKYASTGTQVLRNEKAYVNVSAGSKVWCEIMSPSSAPGNVTIQGAKIYAMQRYLTK